MLRQTAKYAVARWVPGLVNFLAVVIYTRLLDTHAYGSFALAIAWVALGNSMLYQWLRNGVRRYLVAFRHERPDFLHTAVRAFLLLSGLVVLLGAVVLLLQPTAERRVLVGLGLLTLLAMAWVELNLEVVLAEVRPGRYGIAMLMRAVTSLCGGTIFAALGFGAPGVLAGVTLGYVIGGGWLTLVHARGLAPGTARPAILRQVVHYGVPLTLTYGLETIVISSDRVLLGWLDGTTAVGGYAASYNITQQAMTALMVTVNLGAYPMAVRALELGGVEEARTQLRRHATLLMALGLPAAVALSLLAPNLAHVMLGPGFRELAPQLMPVIAFGGLLAGLKVCYFDLAFQLGQATARQVWASGGAALSNVLFSLLLIPPLGAVGAAWAALLAFGVGLLLSVSLGRRAFDLPVPRRAWLGVALAATVMGGVLWLLREQRGILALAAQGACGLITYGVVILALDVGGLRRVARERLGARGVF